MSVSSLEEWYQRQCNGEWEHLYGIHVETIDNPGWCVRIDLAETRKDASKLETRKIERSKDDWIHTWVEDNKFHIACGPRNLSEAAAIFVHWFDSE